MEIDSTRFRVGEQNVWDVSPRLFTKSIDESRSLEQAKQECESTVARLRSEIREYGLGKDEARKQLALLNELVNNHEDKKEAFGVILSKAAVDKLPVDFEKFCKSLKGFPIEEVAESLNSESAACDLILQTEVEKATETMNELKLVHGAINSVWKEFHTGEESMIAKKKPSFRDPIARSMSNLAQRMIEESKMTFTKKNAAAQRDVAFGSSLEDSIRGFTKQTVAHKLEHAKKVYSKDAVPLNPSSGKSAWDGRNPDLTKDSDDKKVTPITCWGDYSSTDEEENEFSSIIDVFGSNIESKSFIEIPKDFKDHFPTIFKSYRKIAEKWGWELRESSSTLNAEGFIAQHVGAPGANKAAIAAALNDAQKVAVSTFVALLGSVVYRPGSIAAKEKSTLVSGYVTSLFLKKAFKDKESEEKYLKISLKGTDAGRSLIQSRVYQCFRTGSAAAKILMNTVDKMLAKIVSIASDEEKQDVFRGAASCFTSYQGMMQNCFRTVSKREAVSEDSSGKGGKKKTVRRFVTKQGKDRPNLNVSNLELTQKELETLRAKESSFNKLEEVISTVIAKKRDCKDVLMAAKVTKSVIDLAYDKIGTIRQINKTRRNAIRARAQELAGESKPITSAHWLKAKSELVSCFQEIDKDIIGALEWDVDKINRDISL